VIIDTKLKFQQINAIVSTSNWKPEEHKL